MKKSSFVLKTAVSAVFILTTGLCAFSQWPQWRGPSRDGASNERNLVDKWPENGPRLAWSSDKVGDGFSSAVIQDGMVFTAGKVDSVELLTALDINGNVKWQSVIGRALQDGDWQQSRCTPTFYKNKIYALTSVGDIACFDAGTGKTDWKFRAFERFEGTLAMAESPLVIDDKVIITPCGHQTTMVALDRLTGKTIWKSESLRDSAYFSSPVLIKGKNKSYVFQSTNMNDFIIDPSTGKIIWRGNKISGMIPQVINNRIYFSGGTKGGTLCRWDEGLTERTVLWNDSIVSMEIGGVAVLGNRIILSVVPRGIASLDLNSGKFIAGYNKIRTCNFLAADNMLYCYEDGTAMVYQFRINQNNFELLGTFKTASGTGPAIAHMALANGLLYIRHGKVLMAYDLKG